VTSTNYTSPAFQGLIDLADDSTLSYELDDLPAMEPSDKQRYPLQDLMDVIRPRNLQQFAERSGLGIRALHSIARRGLSHREADHLCVRLGTVPEAIWPHWLYDDSGDAVYDPTPAPIERFQGVKFRPGGLGEAIMEIAKYHLGEPISVASVARELGRSRRPAGVHLCIKGLVNKGRLQVWSRNPMRYYLPAEGQTAPGT
jgi:hypothetical protein